MSFLGNWSHGDINFIIEFLMSLPRSSFFKTISHYGVKKAGKYYPSNFTDIFAEASRPDFSISSAQLIDKAIYNNDSSGLYDDEDTIDPNDTVYSMVLLGPNMILSDMDQVGLDDYSCSFHQRVRDDNEEFLNSVFIHPSVSC